MRGEGGRERGREGRGKEGVRGGGSKEWERGVGRKGLRGHRKEKIFAN